MSEAKRLCPQRIGLNPQHQHKANLMTTNSKIDANASSNSEDLLATGKPLSAKGLIQVWDEIKQAFIEAANAVESGLKSTVALFPHAEPAVQELANRSIFLSGYFGISELRAFGEKCASTTIDDLEASVLDMYRASVDEHFQCIEQDYATRKVFIRPAVDAHHRGDYALSILGFLAQADGICAESLQSNLFFQVKNLRDLIQARRSQILTDPVWEPVDIITPYRRLLLLPLSEVLPVGYNQAARLQANYTGLNRNLFLHGEANPADVTEENSLKAFSLLSYVASVCTSVRFWDDFARQSAVAPAQTTGT